MLFDKPDTLVLLKVNSLEIYVRESADVARLEFPKKIVEKGKLVDKEAFATLFRDHIKGAHLEQRKAVVVLAEGVVQFQLFPVGPEQTDLIDKFFVDVSIEPNNLVKQVLPADEESLALAVDKSIFSEIVDVLRALDWRVETVASELVFDGVSSKKELSVKQVESVFDAGKVLEDANLLNHNESIPVEAKSSRFWLYFWAFCVGLIFLGVLVYALYSFGLFKNLLNGKSVVSLPAKPNLFNYSEPVTKGEGSASAAAVTKKDSSTTAVKFLKKEEVKIQILNGSGVSGQAAKAQDKLEEAGFKDFELGNSSNLSTTGTLYTYSANVSPEFRKEIDKALESLSSKVLGKEASGSSSFDVNIILGK